MLFGFGTLDRTGDVPLPLLMCLLALALVVLLVIVILLGTRNLNTWRWDQCGHRSTCTTIDTVAGTDLGRCTPFERTCLDMSRMVTQKADQLVPLPTETFWELAILTTCFLWEDCHYKMSYNTSTADRIALRIIMWVQSVWQGRTRSA